ncbi:hypothetical protein [Rhodococcus pyridinivorans]|uniref:hypothetical protein n=1 Tax=Rhodococcus pyridinivorans TaxID=103816 RepID=UPI003AAF7281
MSVALERGRLPMILSMAMSGGIALITAFRFAILVQFLTPDDYGRINIYSTLTSVVPLVMSLGMSVQYQRIARATGSQAIPSLTRATLVVHAFTTLPTLVIVALISRPLGGEEHYFWAATMTVIIALATSVTTLYSQTALGLGYRTTASGMLFLVNAAGAVPLLPIWISSTASVNSILAWWAAGAVAACAASRLILPKTELSVVNSLDARMSYREGLLTLPVQVGPWLLIFLVRYIIGLNIDASAIAAFAIASTVADMGFLVATAALGYFSNRLMTNHISPTRALILTAPVLIVITIAGGVVVDIALPAIGKGGDYTFPILIAVLLAVFNLIRLYINAWRPRIVGIRKLQSTSWVYIGTVISVSILLLTWKPTSLEPYAYCLIIAFALIAAVQRFEVLKYERGLSRVPRS